MCALAPVPTPNWRLLHPIGHEISYIYEGTETIGSSPQLPPQSPGFTETSFDPRVVKKLSHNASERDRRRKVNGLYSSLRSLLPVAHRMKKLSFPATVSYAVKYIPELQEQLERLVQKKEEVLLRISQQGGIKCCSTDEEELRISRNERCSSSAAVSLNRVSSGSEVGIQISMNKEEAEKTQLSEILHVLEQQGFLLLSATSFESYGGMVFYNFHIQVEPETDTEALREKLLALIVW